MPGLCHSIQINMSKACASGVCDGGADGYGDMCSEMDLCSPLGDPGSAAAAVWACANAAVGLSGNLLTLAAIPAARRKKK